MARELSRQIQSRQVNKEYLALVTPGAGRRLELGMSGTVDVGLKDDDGRMSVGDSGHRSITHWRVLGRKVNPFIGYFDRTKRTHCFRIIFH